jgi:hypothetical protein
MVEESVTDGKRIAQLLASEFTGLERGPLDAIEVVDADPDATPSATGTEAYRLVRDGETIAVASMFPDRVELTVEADAPWDGGEMPELTWAEGEIPELCDAADGTVIVTSGAAVKRAVDGVCRVLEGEGDYDSNDAGDR